MARREVGELCLITDRGWAKRVALEDLAGQGRGGMGAPLVTPAKETGDVAAAVEVHAGEDLMAITGGGRTVRVKMDSVPKTARGGAPEKAVALTGNERVAAVTYVAERELPSAPPEEEESPPPPPPVSQEEEVAPPSEGSELDLFS